MNDDEEHVKKLVDKWDCVLNRDPDEKYNCKAILIEAQDTWVRDDELEASKLPGSFDARDWAEEFVRLVKENPQIPYDEECMIGWFANALMRGWDEHGSRTAKEDKFVYILTNFQTGETIATYSKEPSIDQCHRDYSLHLGYDLKWCVPHWLPESGQGADWNCTLKKWKIDSINRLHEDITISNLKYETTKD